MKTLLSIAIALLFFQLTYSQENLKIEWIKKYEWKVLTNQENESMHMVELIPGTEEAENWTLLAQIMSIKGAKGIPMDEAQNLMFEQTKATAPNAKLTFIEKDETDEYPWILFKIESPNFVDDPKPESQLWYIRQGETALFVSFIAQKKKKLKDGFVKEWSKVFKESEIVQSEEKKQQ